jgi:hypothetical protein
MNIEQLKSSFKKNKGNDVLNKSRLINYFNYYASSTSSKTTLEDFYCLLDESGIKNKSDRYELLECFIESPYRSTIGFREFKLLYDFFNTEFGKSAQLQRRRNTLFVSALTHNNKNGISLSELVDILIYFDIKDKNIQSVLENLREGKKENTEAFVFLTAIFKSNFNVYTSDVDFVVELYRNIDVNITVDELGELFRELNIQNNTIKSKLICTFLSKEAKNQAFSFLKEGLNNNLFGDFKYRIDIIVSFLRSIDGHDVQQLVALADHLYPTNELLKIQLFEEAVLEKIINSKNIFSLGLEKIKSDDFLLEFLNSARKNDLLKNEVKVLTLVKDRTHAKYDFLIAVIGDGLIQECVTDNSFANLNGIFNNYNLTENNVTLLGLFSYFDVMGQIEDFSKMLKPEIKILIKEAFYPSSKTLIVSKEEIDKLKIITGSGNEIENKFISVEVLCDYFLKKINISPLTLNDIEKYQLDFKECELNIHDDGDKHILFHSMLNVLDYKGIEVIIENILEKDFKRNLANTNKCFDLTIKKKEIKHSLNQKIAEFDNSNKNVNTGINILSELETDLLRLYLNQKFRDLLRSTNLDKEQVSFFFSTVFSLDISNVTAGKQKLTDFFTKNKKELAHFFANGGLKGFTTFLSTLNDGCSSNLGSQFTIGLYVSLLKDNFSDPILFSILSEYIVTPILNKGDGDVIGVEDNPLKNTAVRSYFLSPAALIEQIGKFETIQSHLILIEKIINNVDKKTAIFALFDNDEGKIRQFSGYLLLENTKDLTVCSKIKDSTMKIFKYEIENKNSGAVISNLSDVEIEVNIQDLIEGKIPRFSDLIMEAKADREATLEILNKNNKMDLDK